TSADKFAKEKRETLQAADLSRKGAIDARIKHVVEHLNALPQYYTTSSCSGRTVLFSSSKDSSGHTVRKKGCIWLNVSHELLGQSDLELSLSGDTGSAVLKFEPFILHVRCETLEDARKLLATSIGAGCRNSGIMISKTGSVHVAVRTTLSMEVPLSKGGNLLVTPQYLEFVTSEANAKMAENLARLERFFAALRDLEGARGPGKDCHDRCNARPLQRDGRAKNDKPKGPADSLTGLTSLFDDATSLQTPST
ncbi:unnamed protein product, partial [Ixodes hexagonus]